MKHTQGTWKAEPGTFYPDYNVKTESGRKIALVLFPKNAITGEIRPEIEANARLIAAAPELLLALKACARHLNTNNEEDRVLYEIAIEAINKATQDS